MISLKQNNLLELLIGLLDHLFIHVLVPITGTWHLLSAPLLLVLSNIKIVILFIELVVVLSTFLRWLKAMNRASGLFDTTNTLFILVHISYYEIIF